MSTITYWTAGDKTGHPGPANSGNAVGVHQVQIDFSEKNAASGDVVRIANIPAGTRVLGVGWEVTTAEGDTCTATIGDGDDPNGWDAQINLNSAASGQSTSGTDAYAVGVLGKEYSAADTIDLTMSNAADAAIVTFAIPYITLENT